MRTWTANATARALPDVVLDALCDPDACRMWAPVAFDVEDDARLRTGTRTRVSGRLAGRRVGFEVEVHRAEDGRLELSADGPVRFDVLYELAPRADGSDIVASVSVHPGRGLLGTLLAEATNGLLKAGALSTAVDRLARVAATA
jgi:hypothetical protein